MGLVYPENIFSVKQGVTRFEQSFKLEAKDRDKKHFTEHIKNRYLVSGFLQNSFHRDSVFQMWKELHSAYSHEQIAEKLLEMSIEGTDARKDRARLGESSDQNLMFQQGLNIAFYRKFQKLREQVISDMTKKYVPLKKKQLSDAASDLKILKLVEQRKALK